MKLTWKMRWLTLMIAFCMVLGGGLPAAAAAEPIEVILTDVTETDLTTLSGEAKIKVSVKGASGNVSIAQMALSFTGDLAYKSIQFLQGENNPPDCVLYSPNASLVNSKKELMPSIIARDPIGFSEETDLFVLTFAGDPGDSVTLSLDQLKSTYCVVDGQEKNPAESNEITVQASGKQNEGKQAVVKLVMDSITDFAGVSQDEGYQGSGIEVKITSETIPGYTFYTIINNTLVSKGGHRENETIPTFTVENTVLQGDTYTVEVSGVGYLPYVARGITFDEAVEITNADFVPGDINADGTVDDEDKSACETIIADGDYNEAADFNRDGVVDRYDMEVFSKMEETEGEVPDKMSQPKVTGGNQEITVNWVKPADHGDEITGYTIQYGTSAANLNRTKEIANGESTSESITGLLPGTTYYVSIAAKNKNGTGEFSDAASAQTDTESGAGTGNTGNNGGNTGNTGNTGNVGSIGNSGNNGNTGNTGNTDNSQEGFTDLEHYDWAKDSIYLLKNKGIISGTSETTYSPGSDIKRGDFILILTKMLEVNNEFTENFSDVPADSYYYEAIGKAKAAGIAYGSGEDFMPEASITRQDLITLAYRAFLAKGYLTEAQDRSSLDIFQDKDDISEYAVMAMASMVSAGVIQGNDGYVNPLGYATRAEVAVMCAKLLALMNEA